MKKFFYDKYSSIISAKLITNPQTGRSKGFAFIEFINYKEFHDALNPKEPIIFGKQKLVFNSAKNKYDFDEEIKDNLFLIKKNSGKININEETNSINGSDSFDNSLSTAIISRDSNGSNKSNNMKNCFKDNDEGFLEGGNKPDEKQIYKNNKGDNLLTLQIKYALNRMREQYKANKSSFYKTQYFNNYCEYYLGNGSNTNNAYNIKEKEDIDKSQL